MRLLRFLWLIFKPSIYFGAAVFAAWFLGGLFLRTFFPGSDSMLERLVWGCLLSALAVTGYLVVSWILWPWLRNRWAASYHPLGLNRHVRNLFKRKP